MTGTASQPAVLGRLLTGSGAVGRYSKKLYTFYQMLYSTVSSYLFMKSDGCIFVYSPIWSSLHHELCSLFVASLPLDSFRTKSSFCCCCCSVAKSCPTLCHPTDCSTPGFPVFHVKCQHLSWGCISYISRQNNVLIC